jgi:hypothetical protein
MYTDTLLVLWCKSIFSYKAGWQYNRTCMRMLNTICAVSFMFDYEEEVQRILSQELQEILMQFISLQKKAQSQSYSVFSNPVETVKNHLASTYIIYPSIIMSSSSLSSVLSNAVEKEYYWTAYFGFLAEFSFETEQRLETGHLLSKDSKIHVTDIKPFEKDYPLKPISSYLIYRIVDHLLEIPILHPVTPLLWQVM